MAFLVTSPISMITPIMLMMLNVPRVTISASITPISDSGSDSMIASGCRKLPNWRRQDQVDEHDGQQQRLDHVPDRLHEVLLLAAEVEPVARRQADLREPRLHVARHVGERPSLVVALDGGHALEIETLDLVRRPGQANRRDLAERHHDGHAGAAVGLARWRAECPPGPSPSGAPPAPAARPRRARARSRPPTSPAF